jgi:Transposase, Mutator family
LPKQARPPAPRLRPQILPHARKLGGMGGNAAVVQALIDNLVERGLDPAVPRVFIIDGANALSKAIRRTLGRHTPIQRCQIHKARNIIGRLSPSLHASVRRVLRQAWELEDADKAEKLIRKLPRRLEYEAPGVSGSILEGLDEMVTVTTDRAATRARLHQHHREHDGHGASGLPEREALAHSLDGAALDRCCYARSEEGLS